MSSNSDGCVLVVIKAFGVRVLSLYFFITAAYAINDDNDDYDNDNDDDVDGGDNDDNGDALLI